LYPDAKLLVFCTEPWKLTGTQGVAINDKLSYAVGKWKDEYLIIAEKRVSEFVERTGSPFKTLIVV
jgi:isoleucyl-tRNA synthetase